MDTYGDVSKKLIPRRKASRTEAFASSSETVPKTLPRGDAPKPTQLSFSPCSLAPGARAWPFDSELLGCLGCEKIVEDENEERKRF